MPKFSIIIPVYNVEKYLRKCLDSIANQTYSDFEAICVNDGSTDNSLAILTEYSRKDGRFKVVSQENQGQGVARNYALMLATGEYIGFVDPDDWVELNWLQEVADKISKTNADLIEFNNYENFESDGREKVHKDKIHLNSNKVFNFKTSKKYLLGNCLAVWNKFIKIGIIKKNNIKFPAAKRSEDTIFSLKAKIFAKTIAYIDKPLYHYLIRQNSSVNSISAQNMQVIDCFCEIKDFLKEQKLFDNYKNEFYNNALQTFHHAYISLPENLKSEFVNKTEDFFESRKYSKAVINGKKTFLKQLFSVVNIYEFSQKMGKQITILGIRFEIPKCNNVCQQKYLQSRYQQTTDTQVLDFTKNDDNKQHQGIVSICIPTYNRAAILNQMLESITNETIFQETSKVEIVISDNCSTDNTFSVCQKYVQLYPNKIFYSRNKENIGGDANFINVLSLAHNKLLKLCNDTCIFRKGALEKIVNVAEVCEAEKPVVFFTNKIRKKYIDSNFCYCNSLNEFVAKVGHRMTWTGSFAIWKDDLAQFDDITRCVKLQLFQTDVILRQMELKGKAFVNNESLFEVPICANKGGYNPAIVFGVNYLTKLLYPYVEKGLLSKRVYENEKKRVLKDTTIPYCVDINNEYSFKSEGFFEILKPIYGKNFYFYNFLANAYLHRFINNHFYPIISYFDCLKVNLKLNFYQVLKNKSKVDKYKQRLNILKLNYAQRSSK